MSLCNTWLIRGARHGADHGIGRGHLSLRIRPKPLGFATLIDTLCRPPDARQHRSSRADCTDRRRVAR